MSDPLEQFHVGSDQASVFSNEGKHGEYLTARLNGRGFKNDDGDWQRTHSYGLRQLTDHVALCNHIISYMISNQPTKADAEQDEAEQST